MWNRKLCDHSIENMYAFSISIHFNHKYSYIQIVVLMRHSTYKGDQDLKKLVTLIKCEWRFLLRGKGTESRSYGTLVGSQEIRQLHHCYIKHLILIPPPRLWRIGEKWTELELRDELVTTSNSMKSTWVKSMQGCSHNIWSACLRSSLLKWQFVFCICVC